MSNQLDLYQQVILEHNRKPKNFHCMDEASHQAEGYNPLCGDHLWVYLKVDNDEKIVDISFSGSGCAISKASASMMTSSLKGKHLSEAKALFTQFQQLLKGELDPEKDSHDLGKLKIFSSIWQYPSRIKCAGLAWHAMNGALEQSKESITTE
ncbi:MAG: SUF system NifU family Fe-S cluster assembly protein [Oligoflexales bacterium]|nr:SUF system NifU family Fe-S cluster assembly protein [Oligoflexales bacterium]